MSMLHPPVARTSLPKVAQSSPMAAWNSHKVSVSAACNEEPQQQPEEQLQQQDSDFEDSTSLARSWPDSEPFFDAASEAGSVSSSTVPDGEDGSSPAVDKSVATAEWEARFYEEQQACKEAEACARKLVSETEALRRRLLELEKASTLQAESDTSGTAEQVQASSDKTAVGRLVAAAVATVIAENEAERKWAAEIAMLRQRIQRSAMMEAVAERRQLQDQETEQAMSRKLQQVGMAVALASLGALAAVYLFRGTVTSHTSK